MIFVKEHVDAQTILTMFPDIMAPEGSYIINMNMSQVLFRAELFNRAEQLGGHFNRTWPYSWPLYYIMEYEKGKKGAQIW
jgi:hypothetical protein